MKSIKFISYLTASVGRSVKIRKPTSYLVATKVGGVMEQPHYTYSKREWIEASSRKEAIRIYNIKHDCSYFYGEVIGDNIHGQYIFDEPFIQNSFN